MTNHHVDGTRIVFAEAWLCDIPVETVRTDAVQTFLKQETIFVGSAPRRARGDRLLLHDRHRRRAVLRCCADLPARRRARLRRRCVRKRSGTGLFRNPRHDGRRDHLARARRGRHRAVGRAVPARRDAAVDGGRRRSAVRAALRHRGRLAAPDDRRARRRRARHRRAGLRGVKIKVGKPRGHEDLERLSRCASRRRPAWTSWSTRTSR